MTDFFNIEFVSGWDKHFSKLDKSEKYKIWKKINQLSHLESTRHLKHGIPYFTIEIGQYRVCFREESNTRFVLFAGNHKQYEKWIKKQS